MIFLVPTSHGEMHRLIPNADAVELAFVSIYILQAANGMMCLITYFYRFALAFIAGLKSNVLANLIILFTILFIINLV